MAIQPLSAGFQAKRVQNVVDNISFGAKERKSRGNNVVRNYAMAVPLATLLAMSPLNSTQAQKKATFTDPVHTEIYQKMHKTAEENQLFKYGVGKLPLENGGELDINFNYSKRKKQYEFHIPRQGRIGKLRPTTMYLVGNDGAIKDTLEYNQVLMQPSAKSDHPTSSSDENLYEFLLGFKAQVEKEGDAVEYVMDKPRTTCHIVTSSSKIDSRYVPHMASVRSAFLKDHLKSTAHLGEMEGYSVVDTKTGSYNIYTYLDGDKRTVTYKKLGEGEYQVLGLYNRTYHFYDNLNIAERNFKFLEVVGEKGEKYTVGIDDELYHDFMINPFLKGAIPMKTDKSGIFIYGQNGVGKGEEVD